MDNDEQLKKFNHYKKRVQRIYPGATTKMYLDKNVRKFYIVDKNGYRILNNEYYIRDSLTVFLAWKNTAEMIWNKKIIDRNNRKFDEDKMWQNLIKKIKERSDNFSDYEYIY